MEGKPLLTISLILLFFLAATSSATATSFPLSTRSKWIVTSSGHRFKLRCVNWPGHLSAMVAEGLEKKPLDDIAAKVASTGFNCVRFTWALFMFTRTNYTKLTVSQSLDLWNLTNAKAGIAQHNPHILNLSILDAQRAVVSALGAHNVKVVLDNHISRPMWCCNDNDGNGFFGDKDLDPDEWLRGLTIVAKLYKNNPAVVAMSIRNEPRGPRQNENDWYKYMQKGAKVIHKANPEVLVLISGLSYSANLEFLKKKPVEPIPRNKMVYEAHWYSWFSFGSELGSWVDQPNEVCGNASRLFIDQIGFVATGSDPYPLFLSEFGVDQRGDEGQDRFLSCFLAKMAEMDLDWAMWALQGSYMLRENNTDMEEVYGVLSYGWDRLRNPKLIRRLQLIQQSTHDPNSITPSYYILYHPHSGQCVQVGRSIIYGADCWRWSRWSHEKDGGPISLAGGRMCLKALGDGLPVAVSRDCSGQQSMWSTISASKLHIATKDKQGKLLCLERNPDSNSPVILTKKCLCVGDDSKDVSKCGDDPQRQWFKLVPSNRHELIH
ncbi:Cellulase [Bertholletia excelsa]